VGGVVCGNLKSTFPPRRTGNKPLEVSHGSRRARGASKNPRGNWRETSVDRYRGTGTAIEGFLLKNSEGQDWRWEIEPHAIPGNLPVFSTAERLTGSAPARPV